MKQMGQGPTPEELKAFEKVESTVRSMRLVLNLSFLFMYAAFILIGVDHRNANEPVGLVSTALLLAIPFFALVAVISAIRLSAALLYPWFFFALGAIIPLGGFIVLYLLNRSASEYLDSRVKKKT